MGRPVFKAGFLCFVLAITSCQEAELSGGSGKKAGGSNLEKDKGNNPPNGVDQKANRTPEIDDFEETGWVPDDLREEFDEFFKTDSGTGTDDDDSGTDTGTDGDKSSGDDPLFGDDNVFWMGCDKAEDRDYKIEGPAGLKMRLSGEFCPTKPVEDKLTVLFVVDFSGSMFGNTIEGPNDPTVGDGCGRLNAAKALVDSYASSEFKGVRVDVGMVGFSNDASLRIPFTDAKSAKSELTAGRWCGSDSPVARTNYQAAFQQAESALSSVAGEKVVFFISDGSPTTGAGDPESAGRSAAESLRNNIKDLTLNIIFLGYKNGQAKNPQGYLESVAGSKDKVTLVPDADKLVEAIQAIGAGLIKIKKSDVEATIKVNGKEVGLGLAKFQKNPKRLNRWVYATEAFELKGEKGKTVEHTIKVTAVTSDGKSLKSGALVQYIQQ